MRAMICIFAGSLLFLGGCRTADRGAGGASSEIDRSTAARISDDVASALTGAFGPGQTTFAIQRAAGETLRAELEHALRRRGYAIAGTPATGRAIPLICDLDRVDPPGLTVSIRAGSRFESSWCYGPTESGVFERTGLRTIRSEVASERRSGLRSPGRRWATLASLSSGSVARRVSGRVSDGSTHRFSEPPAAIDAPPIEARQARPAVPPGGPVPPPVAVPATAGAASVDDADELIVLSPNGEHAIEISAALLSGASGSVPNPFVRQYRPKTPQRELALALSGVALGPRPTAVLNERVCSIGERLGEFQVIGIQRDLVLLRWENFLLRIPLEERTVVVRFP